MKKLAVLERKATKPAQPGGASSVSMSTSAMAPGADQLLAVATGQIAWTIGATHGHDFVPISNRRIAAGPYAAL